MLFYFSERLEDKTNNNCNKNMSKQRFSHGSLSSDEPHSGRTTPTPPPLIIQAPAQLRQTLAGTPRDSFKRPHNSADNRRHSLVQTSNDSHRSFLQPEDHRRPRRSVSSSSASEDHLDELIPGGTVLQLSRYGGCS